MSITKLEKSNRTPEALSNMSVFERRESEVRSYCRNFPTVFERAYGALLFDEGGETYLDFLAGCSTLNYGHNHPVLKEALLDYVASDGVAHGLDMHTSAKAEFLETFEKLILERRGLDYAMMFTGPTGANAVEAAVKLARKVTGRSNIIAFTNGFHGMTMGALSCTGNAGKRAGAGAPLSGVTHMPYDGFMDGTDTSEFLDAMLSNSSSGIDAPAAVILETVQGEGGLNACSPEWLRNIARVAKKHGALLIIDDIQAGVGRMGTFFSFEEAGVKPDIVALAKSLSGYGLPMAVTLFRPELDIWKPGEHNGTFRGNNHAFVTATAALRTFWADDAFAKSVRLKSELLKERLEAMAERFSAVGARVKGRGMMMGLDVGSGEIAAAATKRAFREKLVIETSGARDEVVKVLCPLTIDDSNLARGLDIMEEAIAASIAENVKKAA